MYLLDSNVCIRLLNKLMIAAIALANDAVLVTHNQREFNRISGLHLEDWESD